MSNSIIKDKSYKFALDIIKSTRQFPQNQEGFIISRQIIRSATSIGANVEEALTGFTKDDFIYKMNLSLKESAETNYWLRLIKDLNLISADIINPLINESIEIRKILTSIVKTSRENKAKNKTVNSKL